MGTNGSTLASFREMGVGPFSFQIESFLPECQQIASILFEWYSLGRSPPTTAVDEENTTMQIRLNDEALGHVTTIQNHLAGLTPLGVHLGRSDIVRLALREVATQIRKDGSELTAAVGAIRRNHGLDAD